jgi:hypothetical protein
MQIRKCQAMQPIVALLISSPPKKTSAYIQLMILISCFFIRRREMGKDMVSSPVDEARTLHFSVTWRCCRSGRDTNAYATIFVHKHWIRNNETSRRLNRPVDAICIVIEMGCRSIGDRAIASLAPGLHLPHSASLDLRCDSR